MKVKELLLTVTITIITKNVSMVVNVSLDTATLLGAEMTETVRDLDAHFIMNHKILQTMRTGTLF